MSLLRTSRSLIPRCSIPQPQLLICTRQFHTPPPLNAQPRRSPRVKAASQYRQTNGSLHKRNPTYNVEDSLPSMSILQTAQKEGILDLEPEKTLQFLHAFSLSNSMKSTGTWEEKLCADHQISPLDLYQISTAMVPPVGTTPSPVLALARSLMKTSCSLGCKEATCTIIYAALQGKKEISHISEPFKHLKQLGNAGDKQAMTLLGLVLVEQKNLDEALSWFIAAIGWTPTDPNTSTKGMDTFEAPPQPDQDIDFDGANEALLWTGKLLMKMHPFPVIIAQAQDAFRLAALELDDPESYFHLSKLMADQIQRENSERAGILTADELSKQYDLVNFYLQKAAASGIQEALDSISKSSSIQTQQQQQGEDTTSNARRPDMATEWAVFGREFKELKAYQGKL